MRLIQPAWMIVRCEECTGRAYDIMKVEEKRGELAAHAIVFSKLSCGKQAKLYTLANASYLASCIGNHSQSAKTANSSPVVVDTPEPTVYICTIISYYINSVGPKVCANWLLICNLSMVLS